MEGRTSLAALKEKQANASYFIRKFYRDNYEQAGSAISFDAVNEDGVSNEQVLANISAREWHHEQDISEHGYVRGMSRGFTPPNQFEAAWRDQIKRYRLGMDSLGYFLSDEEAEEILDDST